MTPGIKKDLCSYPWQKLPPPHPSAVRMCQLSAWLPSPTLLQLSRAFNQSWKVLCWPFPSDRGLYVQAVAPHIKRAFLALAGHSQPSAGAVSSSLPVSMTSWYQERAEDAQVRERAKGVLVGGTMGPDCSVMVYQVSAWKNNQSGCLGNLTYLLGANKHQHHRMQVMGKKSGDLCKFCFGRAVLVRVSSLGKWHQGTRADQLGLQSPAASTAWLCLSSWHWGDLWLIPFPSFQALVSSCHLIALSCWSWAPGRGRLQVPFRGFVRNPQHHRAEPSEHLQAAAPTAAVTSNSKNKEL